MRSSPPSNKGEGVLPSSKPLEGSPRLRAPVHYIQLRVFVLVVCACVCVCVCNFVCVIVCVSVCTRA